MCTWEFRFLWPARLVPRPLHFSAFLFRIQEKMSAFLLCIRQKLIIPNFVSVKLLVRFCTGHPDSCAFNSVCMHVWQSATGAMDNWFKMHNIDIFVVWHRLSHC